MHMLEFPHDVPLDKDERKQAGLAAQASYPAGYRPAECHPMLLCRPADRPALRRRLERDPWKSWHEHYHRPAAELAMAAADLAELRSPGFNLKLFPLGDGPFSAIQGPIHGPLWMQAICNCAFFGWLAEDAAMTDKAARLLVESVEQNWCIGGWGGEDYEIGSGWDAAWVQNVALLLAYDFVADRLSPEQRHRFEARVARDLEFCQTDPVSPRYNPSWFSAFYMTYAALLLGRDDYVRKIEAMLDQYVEQVLWGEGDYWEGGHYQSGCMEGPNIAMLFAIRHATGRDPSANPRWAMRAEHWIRRMSPLASDATHSDAALLECSAPMLLASASLLPPVVAGWTRWAYERANSPDWFPLGGSDDDRRRGLVLGRPVAQTRRARHRPLRGFDPAFWIMTPDPLPEPIAPPAGSYVARSAGVACLRSDWSPAAMHTAFYAPRYYGSPHSHWDSLTFDFWAHGAYLVKNVGYHEMMLDTPDLPPHIAAHLGLTREPIPVPPHPPYTTWQGWSARNCYRMSPDMHNIPTIDRGGGNHWTSRADPICYLVNRPGPAWAQAVRADGGVASSYTQTGVLGTHGTVRRSLVQVEPDGDWPGYLVVVDAVVPEEVPNARCDWFLHPRGMRTGQGARQTWTTCDFLHWPPRDVALEVCLPPVELHYELRPDGHHFRGGNWQPGQYLDVTWRGRRRFWAVLRPVVAGQTLPVAQDLPDNLGLQIGRRDCVLVRPIHQALLRFDGIETDAAVLIARDAGRTSYLAVDASRASLAGGQIGFETTAAAIVSVHGDAGAIFVDRPHKQPAPMDPVTLHLRDPRWSAGATVELDGKPAGRTQAGSVTLTLTQPGQHHWRVICV